MIGSAPVKPSAAGGWHETSNSELHDVVHTSDNFLQTPLRAFPKANECDAASLRPIRTTSIGYRYTDQHPMNVPQDGYFSAGVKPIIFGRKLS
jgi:hypothetical protein